MKGLATCEPRLTSVIGVKPTRGVGWHQEQHGVHAEVIRPAMVMAVLNDRLAKMSSGTSAPAEIVIRVDHQK
jgi:hypothetical protein